jgi:hypothetical protein
MVARTCINIRPGEHATVFEAGDRLRRGRGNFITCILLGSVFRNTWMPLGACSAECTVAATQPRGRRPVQ